MINVSPSDWQTKTLDQVAAIVNGGTPKSKVSEYWGGSVQWLTPKDMGRMSGREIEKTLRTITDSGLGNSSARLIPENSVILSTRAPIGHLAINTMPMAFNQGCRGLIPKEGVDHLFLYYFLYANRGMLQQLGTGTTFKELSASTLKAFTIRLPPLKEQRRIVAILDKAFSGLDRALTLAETNLQDSRELFYNYLTDLFSCLDSSWEMAQLSKYCEKITVGHVGPMAKRYVASGTLFLRSQNVRPFELDLTDVKYIDDVFKNEIKKSELRPGDVAIVRTGYPGTCAVIPDDLEVANCADLVIVRTGSKLNPHFLALLLNSNYGKKLVAGAAVGAAQKHFNVGAAKRSVFPFPPLETQNRVVDQANELRAATVNLEKNAMAKSADIDELRHAMLQRAFASELT